MGDRAEPDRPNQDGAAAGRPVRQLDLVAASCQSSADGHYTVHRHVAGERPDVVLFLGDYLYEHGFDATVTARGASAPIPPSLATEVGSLERWRQQYAWHKADADLQRRTTPRRGS